METTLIHDQLDLANDLLDQARRLTEDARVVLAGLHHATANTRSAAGLQQLTEQARDAVATAGNRGERACEATGTALHASPRA